MNKGMQLVASALLLFGTIAASTAAQAPGGHHWQHPGGAPQSGAPSTPPAAANQPPAARTAAPANSYATIPGRKTETGERFFIVASIDLQKSQLLLKYPTEVTLLMKVTPQTKLTDESGNPLKLSDFRAGDTLWAISTGSGDDTTAVKVRKGQMTVADLHRYYLDYEAIK